MSLNLVLTFLWIGLVVGGLARLAIPGPDPMPMWLTIAIGLVGAIAGALVGKATTGDSGYGVSFISFVVAIALVGGYRRFVQRRPIWGAGARAFPERGIGVDTYRERLKRVGVNPDTLQPDPRTAQQAQLRGAIEALHRAGLLTDEEAAEKTGRLAAPETDTDRP